MNTASAITAAGIGAGLALMLDPNSGGRRRALARDKMVWATRKTRDGLDATARDFSNRAKGIAAATRGRLARGTDVDDVVLVERVRAKIGRATSHPRAIDVTVQNGEVTLRGPVLAAEVSGLLATAASVRGVQRVMNELEPHETAEDVPSLQGAAAIAGPSLDIMQRNWAPATRALVGLGLLAAALFVAAYGGREQEAH